MEVDSDLDGIFTDNEVSRKIYAELQAWMVSRCPEHLKVISGMSRN